MFPALTLCLWIPDLQPQASSMKLDMNSLQGLNLNWLLIDGGLRRANDNYAYADARTARADVNLTKLDVAFDAADAFLDAVAARQVIRSTTAALEHMEAAKLRPKPWSQRDSNRELKLRTGTMRWPRQESD